jgi:hypothetical protein
MIKIYLLFFSLLLNLPSLAVKISWAQDADGQAVNAKVVAKEDGAFFCFECGKELILRQGEINEAHFAHKHDAAGNCGGGIETWQHIKAKQYLEENLAKWQFVTQCGGCKHPLKKISFDKGQSASSEHVYDRFVVDVMVMRNKTAVAALEVRHSHAVGEAKKEFFLSKRLPLIEVKAEQIIEAFENDTFEAMVLDRKYCQECVRKNSRPCIGCNLWHMKDILLSIPAPAGHRYNTAFVCRACQDRCEGCNNTAVKAQIKQNKYCYKCVENIEKWQSETRKIMKTENLTEMTRLLKNAPRKVTNELLVDVELLQTKYHQITERKNQDALVKRAQELALIVQQEKAILEQWRSDTVRAIEEKNITLMSTLLSQIPRQANEEECECLRQHLVEARDVVEQAMLEQWRTELKLACHDKNCEQMRALLNAVWAKANEEECAYLRAQLLENDAAWQAALTEKARQIVATQRVHLRVPASDEEEVDQYYAQPEGDENYNYSVSVSHIEACAKWLVDSQEVIPVVKALVKEQEMIYRSQKRLETKETPAAKRRRLNDFFNKK